jgi:hypothetical protein
LATCDEQAASQGLGAVDKQLRRRAKDPVLQGEDADRPADDRQFDRQFRDERMLGGESEHGLGENRQIAVRSEQIDSHFEGSRDYRSAGIWQFLCVEDISGKRSKPIVRWRQNPRFSDELGKLDATPSSPWVSCASCVDFRRRLEKLSFAPMIGSPEQFRTLIQEDHARWGPLIRDAGVSLD